MSKGHLTAIRYGNRIFSLAHIEAVMFHASPDSIEENGLTLMLASGRGIDFKGEEASMLWKALNGLALNLTPKKEGDDERSNND